jgi:hypothetical protein
MTWVEHVARIWSWKIRTEPRSDVWREDTALDTGRKWEGKVKVDLKEIVDEAVYCFQVGKDSLQWPVLMNTVMSLRVP